MIAAALLTLAAPASAQNSYELASNLGLVLASEDACDLTFQADAIGAYIESNVAADDMEFAEFLAGTTTLGDMKIERMSASGLAAHCAQIKRVAAAHGFTPAPTVEPTQDDAADQAGKIPFRIGEPIYTKPRP